MKEKTKEFLKKNLIGFVLGVVSACTVSVIAATYFPSNDVTYDNKESGLSSTNVQGAIDELYGVCTAEKVDVGGKDVIVVDEGDGLYEDEYEDGRYIYRGINPNNYIRFNNELWRIISKETDGTYKILRNELLPEEVSFDSEGLRTTGYCSQGDAPLFGCNAWSSTANMVGNPTEFSNGIFNGIVEGDSKILKYLNSKFLNGVSENRDKIINHIWNIGGVVENEDSMKVQLEDEKVYQWNGEVGLISISDYLKANGVQSLCGTFYGYSSSVGYQFCYSFVWMYLPNSTWWTISPIKNSEVLPQGEYFISKVIGTHNANVAHGIRPALYLSSEVKITGGDGSQNNPYTLE